MPLGSRQPYSVVASSLVNKYLLAPMRVKDFDPRVIALCKSLGCKCIHFKNYRMLVLQDHAQYALSL